MGVDGGGEKARHGTRPRSRPTPPARTSLCPGAASSEISDAGTRGYVLRDKILMRCSCSQVLPPNSLVGSVGAEPIPSRSPPVSLEAKRTIRARRIVPCNNSFGAGLGRRRKKARLDAVRVHVYVSVSSFSSPPPPRTLGGGQGLRMAATWVCQSSARSRGRRVVAHASCRAEMICCGTSPPR